MIRVAGCVARGFLSGLLVLALSAPFSPSRAEVGHTPFTRETLPSLDAGALSALVADNRGSVVAVNIFASWCPPCREETPSLIQMRNLFPEKDLVLIGVSVDKHPKALVAFLNELRVNYPVFIAEGDFIASARVRAVPQLLVYDTRGSLVVNHKGLMDEEHFAGLVRRLLAQ